jgi:predicted transposase/invertase (TIGR01784 family)
MAQPNTEGIEFLPTRDAVFKWIFGEYADPSVLASLINAVRQGRQAISELTIVSPESTTLDPEGKRVLLDIKARDADDNIYGIEIQVRRHGWSGERAVVYHSRMVAGHLKAGQGYEQLPCVVGIYLLVEDVYPQEPDQALWSFALRDQKRHDHKLSEAVEIWVVELSKFARLGWKGDALSDWIKFFLHSSNEAIMQTITLPEVKQARAALRRVTDDERLQARLLSEDMWEWDRATELHAAKKEGLEEGLSKGLSKGREESREQFALNLIRSTDMNDAKIAALCDLDVQAVARLRK